MISSKLMSVINVVFLDMPAGKNTEYIITEFSSILLDVYLFISYIYLKGVTSVNPLRVWLP